jgi:hypothetical protein
MVIVFAMVGSRQTVTGRITHPTAHEAKLLGAHFFGLLRGKMGAPRVYRPLLENVAYLQ